MADEPIAELGGLTPLQYAPTPAMDRLAQLGASGRLHTVPDGFHPGSEVANLSILGYDLPTVYEGRGVLEAASMGVDLRPGELGLRCNLICIDGDRIKNHSAGHISSEESDVLIRYLNEQLGSDDVTFHHGVSYRHLLVLRGGDRRLDCTPPHDIPLHPFRPALVKARVPEAEATANRLNDLILRSQQLLADHPINVKRRAVISAVDLSRGIGVYAGMDVIHVEGATGLYDTNYEGKAAAAIEALRTHDFVYLHIEASDEAGHEGDVELKVRTIEYLDRRIVDPVFRAVNQWDEPVAIAVLPDHPTPCAIRTHTNAPIPFVIYKPGATPDAVERYDEFAAIDGSYGLLRKDEFMKVFLR